MSQNELLVHRIRDYWAKIGYNVEVMLTQVPYGHQNVITLEDRRYYHLEIRSNLVSGLPPEDARIKSMKDEPNPVAIPRRF